MSGGESLTDSVGRGDVEYTGAVMVLVAVTPSSLSGGGGEAREDEKVMAVGWVVF